MISVIDDSTENLLAELKKCEQIYKKFNEKSPVSVDKNFDGFVELWDQLIVSGSGHIIAKEIDEKFVAVLALVVSPNPLNGKPMAQEFAWWVEEEHRNSLVGYKLIRKAEILAEEKNCECFVMSCFAGQEDTEKIESLYKKMGFEKSDLSYIKNLKNEGVS